MGSDNPLDPGLSKDFADANVAARRRANKPSFRRFEAWIIGAGAVVVGVFIALTWF